MAIHLPATPRADHGRTRSSASAHEIPPRSVCFEEIVIVMSESSSVSPASSDASATCRRVPVTDRSTPSQGICHQLATTLRQAATLIRTGDFDRAELEILTVLEAYTEDELPAVYIGAVALVRELNLAPMVVGPVLPADDADQIAPSFRGRRGSGQRRDFAYAIATALRVRMNPTGTGTRRSAA